MNPVESVPALEEKMENIASVEPQRVDAEIDATPIEVEPETPAPVLLQADEEVVEDDAGEEEVYSADASSEQPIFYQPTPLYADEPNTVFEPAYNPPAEGEYYITVIQEKNSKQRNMLLLGASVLMLTLTVGAWGVSLFQKELNIGAIGEGTSLAYLIDEVPMQTEEEEQKKDKDDAGGGGGGGKNEPDPVNEGDLPNQTKDPIRPPDPKTHRADFELQTPPPSTEGTKTFEQKYGRWGDPNSRFAGLSSGPGSGGGMGTGTGTGAGSGSGTGAGSGSGSGYGAGDGDGIGDGRGTGIGGANPPPEIKRVTSPVRIISKPRPGYTDAARTNGVTGSVVLKVTLLANGSIGSITPVRRLPHGLTEQAIAAARQIRFEPKKVNGQPVSVVMTFDYGFTIY